MNPTIGVTFDSQNNIIDCGFFYKIIKKEYLKTLQDNKIYMKNLKYYQEVENNVIGDKNEGLLFGNKTGKLLYKGQVVAEVKNLNVYSKLQCPVYCLSQPKFIISENNEYQFVLKREVINSMCVDKNSNYVIVFIPKEYLIKQIEKAVTKIGISCECGNVIYNDTGCPSIINENSIKNVGFVKRKEYSYQNEYRFILNINNNKDEYILDLEDIKNEIKVFDLDSEQELKFGFSIN